MAKILIVDDEGIILMLLKKLLKIIGHEVIGEASNGAEAVKKAGELNPDLILMDIAMPGELDGIAAAVKIRENYSCPLVFVTAYSKEMYAERLEALNNNYGYLVKPFNADQLESAIKENL